MGNISVIPIFSFLGVNNRQPSLHMSKVLVCIHTTDECINQFEIGYMINSTLHANKVLIEQDGKCSRATFNQNTMEVINIYL